MFKNKETKKLTKKDLLEILVIQNKKIDELEEELKKKNHELEERLITIKNSGSIDQAALKLNKIFEKAEQAANDYLESIKQKHK